MMPRHCAIPPSRAHGRAIIPIILATAFLLWVDTASGQATRYLQPLRAHGKNVRSVAGRIASMAVPAADEAQVNLAGQAFLTEARSFRKTLGEFRRSRTRRGLDEEYDLIRASLISMEETLGNYRKLKGLPAEPPDAQEQEGIRSELRSLARQLIQDRIARHLESQGLKDMVTAESWAEARDAAIGHGQRKIKEFLEKETTRIFGIAFHDARSAKRALQMRVRQEIHRNIAKLLVKVTSNEIVVSFVANALIRWIGPKLKEALRVKGNLDARTARSIATMMDARDQLNEFKPDANIRHVRAEIRRAKGAIAATGFLVGDLGRQRSTPLAKKLQDAKLNLERTISITTRRFLLHKKDHDEDLALSEQFMDELIRDLSRIVDMTDVAKKSLVYRLTHSYRVDKPRDPGRPVRGAPRCNLQLTPSLEWADPAAHEKRRQSVIARGGKDPGKEPRYTAVREWCLMRLKCNGETRICYVQGRSTISKNIGRGVFFGLPRGDHLVRVDVITTSGDRFSDTLTMRIATQESVGKNLDKARRTYEQRKRSLATAKPGVGRYFATVDSAFRGFTALSVQLQRSGLGGSKEILDLSREVMSLAELFQEAKPEGKITRERIASQRRGVYTLIARTFGELSNASARDSVNEIIKRLGAHDPSAPPFIRRNGSTPASRRNLTISQVQRVAADLAVSVANDLDAARGHMEASIRARLTRDAGPELEKLARGWPKKLSF